MKFNVLMDPAKSKDKFKVVPDIVPEAVPVAESVLVTSHVVSSRVWTPAALVDPEKEVPVWVRVMENEPPSLNVHPFDPGPVHDQVPTQVPVSGAAVVSKSAVTVWSEFMVTLQPPVPEHAPLHPLKVEPEAGAAVIDRTVPAE